MGLRQVAAVVGHRRVAAGGRKQTWRQCRPYCTAAIPQKSAHRAFVSSVRLPRKTSRGPGGAGRAWYP